MYKKRLKTKNKKTKKLPYGTLGLLLLNSIRYELVYLRFIKKFLRQKHIRKKIFFLKKKFWIFLKPNYILSTKTTNARMGAGVGSIIRVSIRVKANYIFTSMKGYSVYWVLTLYRVLRYKYPFKFIIVDVDIV